MPIQIQLEYRHLSLLPIEQSLVKAIAYRNASRFPLQSRLSSKRLGYNPIAPQWLKETTLKQMISKYSEQLVYQPLEELQYWFTYTSGAFLEPGYPPLFYSRTESKALTPNKSAVAGIGEGVAGFLAQRLYQCRKLARPNHDYPDIIMQGNGKTYLVESKASTGSTTQLKQTLEEELFRIAGYAATCTELDSRPVVALLVGTVLLNEREYQCYVTEVTI